MPRESEPSRRRHSNSAPQDPRSKRDGKPEIEKSPNRANPSAGSKEVDEKRLHRLPDSAPREPRRETGFDKKTERHGERARESDKDVAPRSRSYSQRDERGNAGQDGRSSRFRTADRGSWRDSKDELKRDSKDEPEENHQPLIYGEDMEKLKFKETTTMSGSMISSMMGSLNSLKLRKGGHFERRSFRLNLSRQIRLWCVPMCQLKLNTLQKEMKGGRKEEAMLHIGASMIEYIEGRGPLRAGDGMSERGPAMLMEIGILVVAGAPPMGNTGDKIAMVKGKVTTLMAVMLRSGSTTCFRRLTEALLLKKRKIPLRKWKPCWHHREGVDCCNLVTLLLASLPST